MKKRDIIIAAVLLVSFFVALVVGLVGDRLKSSTGNGTAEKVDLVITEVCAKNTNVIEDNRGRYSDYIEVYNKGGACNLQGFTLSDGTNSSDPLEDTRLDAGEYKVFFIDRDLTGFSISSSGGENIFLKNRDGSNAASVTVSPMQENQVMELIDGSYIVSNRPTPGFPNTEEGYTMFTVGIPDEAPDVLISEVFAANDKVFPDSYGNFSDIIELYNVSDKEISLGSYKLSDTATNRFRYTLPSISLAPGSFVLVYCDGSGSFINNEIHANFGLSIGETVYLTSPQGKYICAEVVSTAEGCSMAYNNGNYTESALSLGFANTEEGAYAFAESRVDTTAPLIISEVLLSGDGIPYNGAFCDAVEIYNRSKNDVDTSGWYLTDGANPCRYALPQKVLAPGECAVVICDGKTDPWHAPFKLSQGESVRLTDPNYKQGAAVAVVSAGLGMSLLAVEDADGIGYTGGEVSMGYPNTETGRKDYISAVMPTELIISELIASNTETLRGPYGASCDWVELYNASSAAINLSDWYLSDDADELSQGALPDYVLKPGERYVVFLSRLAMG